MSIDTELARIKGAKADLKSWIEENGVTVPDGTLIDGLVELAKTVETGGGAAVDVVGAASYMPQTFDEIKAKEVLPVPGDFDYKYAYTAKSDSLTMSIAANAGDTIIAVYAMRHLTETPVAPDGWELIRHCEPHEKDISSAQSLLVYKYSADSSGTVSVTMVQPDSTQRMYGYIVNLLDSLIGSNELVYNIISSGTSINPIHFDYEHTLVLTTNHACYGINSDAYRQLGICWDGTLSTFHPKVVFGDDASNFYNMYSSRLSLMYRPWGSKQKIDDIYPTIRNYNGDVANDSSTSINCVNLLLEIIPGACTKWVTASDDTLTITELEGGGDISATEAMSIILGGETS